jgi:signal transduction histidine kinase
MQLGRNNAHPVNALPPTTTGAHTAWTASLRKKTAHFPKTPSLPTTKLASKRPSLFIAKQHLTLRSGGFAPQRGRDCGEGEMPKTTEAAMRLDAAKRPDRQNFEAQEDEQRRNMALIGQFASGTAHDLGNLFAVIEMALERLRENQRNSELEQQVQCALGAAAAGMAATRALLQVASNQIERSEVFDPNDCLRRFAALLRHAAGLRVRLHLALEPTVWPIVADPHATVLALLNLTMNARDAMPTGGDLHIVSTNVALRGQIEGLTGDFVALRVNDTGSGMPAHVVAQACRPFFTTKGPAHGTGLGLARVREFAQRAGGAVAIASTVGRGATITLYLPRAIKH